MRDDRAYRLVPPDGMLRAALEAHLGPRRQRAEVGDALLFWLDKPQHAVHCGVAVAGGFVHVEIGGRVSFARMADWRRQFVGAFGLRAS